MRGAKFLKMVHVSVTHFFGGFGFGILRIPLAMINLHKFDDSSFTHSKDKKKGPKFKTGLIWMLSYLLG